MLYSNLYLYIDRFMQLSDLIRDVSLCSGQYLMQKFTTRQSIEKSFFMECSATDETSVSQPLPSRPKDNNGREGKKIRARSRGWIRANQHLPHMTGVLQALNSKQLSLTAHDLHKFKPVIIPSQSKQEVEAHECPPLARELLRPDGF